MSLFKTLTIKKNSFTLDQAGAVFKEVADQIEKGKISSQAADTAVYVAEILVKFLKLLG